MYRLLPLIDQEIQASRAQLARDLVRLIRIKSDQGEPRPGAPFGNGPKAMLDEVLRMGAEAGFYTADYGCGVGSLALKPGQPDLGIWLHGDVVPAGEGWIYPPYEGTEYQNCIIGRGATDNKGQLCAIFHLLKIFKKLGLQLGYNPALYCGSNEETGMEDVIGFLRVAQSPRLSLVPDASFPVGYGGKGSLGVILRAKQPLRDLTITAGSRSDPGGAEAIFRGERFYTNTPPGHSAHPKPGGNMITLLCDQLLQRDLPEQDAAVLAFFRLLSLDIHGDAFGINRDPGPMTPLTLYAGKVTMEDGCPAIHLNIRYPASVTAEEIRAALAEKAEQAGVQLTGFRQGNKPYLLDRSWPVIDLLRDIANSVTGDDRDAYTLGGGTYAHRLPNALAFGMDGCLVPEDFPAGHGGAHGLDELVSLDRLERAMKIYARALLALDGMDW